MRWFQVWSTAVKPLMCTRTSLAAASFSASACELAAEHVVGLFGERGEEAPAQFAWEREGEVGCVNEFAQLAVDPTSGGLASALRAGFVIAGMKCEADLAASFARKAAPPNAGVRQ